MEKNKIRLLFVLNTLGVGGAEVQLARTIRHFNTNIFDVQVAYYSKAFEGHPGEMLEEAGVKVTFLDRNGWGKLNYFRKAAAFMRQQEFDIVHAWTGTANLYGRVPAVLAGAPVVLGGLLGRRTANGNKGIIYSITNFRCSGWIVNAQEIKEIASHKLHFMKHSPIYVVPNGIEVSDDDVSGCDEHTFYDDLKSFRPVIGTVGRLVPVKNHRLFVQMAMKLKEMSINADYWIIGDGPMQAEIEAEIKKYNLTNDVKLLGCRKDIDQAMSRMDVFVLTSDSEGCPNVLLEAMRASLPVVSTKCTSLEDMIEDGINGYTVPVNDSTRLAEVVKQILDDQEKRKKMRLESRRIVRERFEMSIAVKRLQEVYFSCLRRASHRSPKIKIKLTNMGLI